MGLLYLGLALALTYPVAARLSSSLAGRGGDGFAFAWNLWWTKTALVDLHSSPLFTTWLFHPFGTSLVFHTHTLANGLLAVPLLCFLDVPTTYNLILFAELVSAALAGHLLARAEGAGRAGSLAAGLVFGFSPHVMTHADYGEHNLSAVGWLGFFLYFFHQATTRGGRGRALAAGAFLALTAYNDYTMFVFALLAAATVMTARAWRLLSVRIRGLVTPILWTGVVALSLEAQGRLLVLKSPGLLLVALALCAIVLGVLRFRSAEADTPAASAPSVSVPRQLGLVAAAFVLTAAPLLWAIGQELVQHQGTPFASDRLAMRWYVQPPGLLIPAELHPSLGWLHAWYWGPRGTHPSQSIGLVAPLLAAFAWWRRKPAGRTAFPWLALAGLFLAFSLGPWVRLSSAPTSEDSLRLRGPFYYLVMAVPFMGAIRAPLRFLAVVNLGLAVGAALGLTRLAEEARQRSKRLGRLVLLAGAGLLLYERLTTPFPTVSARLPEAYAHLLEEPSDGRAVLELPFGFRTGNYVESTERTAYQLYQCVHGRPLTTGFVARSDGVLVNTMKHTPMIQLLQALARSKFPENASTPAPEALRSEAHRFAEDFRIGHILIHENAILVGAEAPVVSHQAFERLVRWVPQMFDARSCGRGPDWACFHLPEAGQE
jgi:hypothetical protein